MGCGGGACLNAIVIPAKYSVSRMDRRKIIFSPEKSHRKPEFFVNLKEEKPGKKRETCRRNRSYLGGGLSNSAVEFRCEAVFTPSIIQIAAMVTVKIKEEQVYGRIEYCDCR